jgi:hypothetical protein
MLTRIVAGMSAVLLCAGCHTIVLNPITPQEARQEVINLARQVVSDLGGDLVTATFFYDSCNEFGSTPFQGHVKLFEWLPDADRSQPVDRAQVLDKLGRRGWESRTEFDPHAAVLKRNGLDVTVYAEPPPVDGVGHVQLDVLGQCRDTFDHRKDRSDSGEDVGSELTPHPAG